MMRPGMCASIMILAAVCAVNHQAIKRFRRIGQERAVIRDASISDRDIQSSRCVYEALKHGPDGFHIGDVTRIRLDPFNSQGPIDLLGRSLAERGIDIVQCHRGSCAGEGLTERIANPCSSPSDENRFSRKGAHVFPPQMVILRSSRHR